MDVQLIKNDIENRKLYLTRWYVLCCLSLMTCLQNIVWIGYGPVAQSAKAVFHWSDSTMDMFVNYGNIGCIIFIIPASWLLDVKGLRLSVILSTIGMAIGTGLRCISTDPGIATLLISVAQTINGISGTVVSAAPPLLSETWFPPNERATATAISIVFASVGTAVAFVVGPQLVSEPVVLNNTGIHNSSFSNSSSVILNLTTICKEIMLMNFIEFGVAVFLVLVVLVYFPKSPPTPPSETAAAKRIDFRIGTFKLLKMVKFWHVALMFAIPIGVCASWGSVLDINLKPFGISQKEAGWLGFYGSIGGTLAGILISRFSDIFMERIKTFLIVIFTTAGGLFIVFTLICNGTISFNTSLLYITCIGGSTLVVGATPLFYELTVETTYPVAEGVTTGLLILALNVTGSLFLLLSLIPNIGTEWPNWALIACVVITVPMLFVFKADYRRLDVDINVHVDNKN